MGIEPLAPTPPLTCRATLLGHSGHGPWHLDLVFARGSRCPTLHLRPGPAGLVGVGARAAWGIPHRRGYLTYAGPITNGRGSVRRCWSGPAACRKASRGWRIQLDHCELHIADRIVRVVVGGLPTGPLADRCAVHRPGGEAVVRWFHPPRLAAR